MRVDCHAPPQLIPLPRVEQKKTAQELLPLEVWENIASFLEPKNLSSMARVSRQMPGAVWPTVKKCMQAWIQEVIGAKRERLAGEEPRIPDADIQTPPWLRELAIRNTEYGQKIRNVLYTHRKDLFVSLVNNLAVMMHDLPIDILSEDIDALAHIFHQLRFSFSDAEDLFFIPLQTLMQEGADDLAAVDLYRGPEVTNKAMCLREMIDMAESEEECNALIAAAEELVRKLPFLPTFADWPYETTTFRLARPVIEQGGIFEAAHIFCDQRRGPLTQEALGDPTEGSLAALAVVPSAEEAEKAVDRARALLNRDKSPRLYTLEERRAAAVLKIDDFLEDGWAESIRRWRADGFDRYSLASI